MPKCDFNKVALVFISCFIPMASINLMLLNLTSHGIFTVYYVWSADLLIKLLMLFSVDYFNIYPFSMSFSVD